jgi:ABC-type nickel/cobalt efflux system permease component RcnA
MLALLAAAGLGALHALEPGHGKTIVSGYLVGSRGTARQAMLLGLSVTATHTLSVYLLGLATLVAARFILPDRLYPILGTASGLAVVAVGLTLVRARLGPALVAARHPSHSSPVPTPMDGTSLATVGHSHPHSHEHGHHHDIHELGHTHVHEAPGMDVHQAAQWVGNGLAPHSHGIGPSHTHPVPGADGSPLSARSLLALGVSGGLLPCPSALVVLLAAISFGNIGLGMALVAAFSVGLALVLMGLGLVVVFGGRAVARTPLALRLSGSPLAGALPALSAVVITIAGTGITLQAIGTWM